MKEIKISFSLALLVIGLTVIIPGLLTYFQLNKLIGDFEQANYYEEPIRDNKISRSEKNIIDAWLRANHLNEYGDPQGTIYTGGTPLFDEVTGKKIDRYDYILKKYPSRPWRK